MLQGTTKLLVLGAMAVMLALPAQAMGQSATGNAYEESSVTIVNSGDPGDPADPGTPVDPGTGSSSSSGGALPFTGIDLALLAAMGGGLLVLGFGMRRLTRRPDPA